MTCSDEAAQTIRAEVDILSLLLTRNKAQHRRANYFRNLSGALRSLTLLIAETTRAPDSALELCTEAALRLRRAAWALRQQVTCLENSFNSEHPPLLAHE